MTLLVAAADLILVFLALELLSLALYLERDQKGQRDDERKEIVNGAVGNERSDDRGRGQVRLEQKYHGRLEHTETSRNVANNAEELGEKKNAEHRQE